MSIAAINISQNKRSSDDLPVQKCKKQKVRTPIMPDLMMEPNFWLTRSVSGLGVSKAALPLPKAPTLDLKQLEKIDAALMRCQLPDFAMLGHCKEINSIGVYATKEIEKGTCLGVYSGYIDKNGKDARYIYTYISGYTLDAKDCGNYTRYINTTLSLEDSNVESVDRIVDGKLEVVLFARKPIDAGEQLLTFYGEGHNKRFGLNIDLKP